MTETDAVLDLQFRLTEVFPSRWRDAIARVPRHAFLPSRFWLEDGGGPVPVDRAEEPQRWLALSYADRPIVTQLDDGEDSGRGYITSSASQPSIVGEMLEASSLAAGDRVLEIDTGTGWNAALSAARVGAENVVTVEIDKGLAEQARQALAAQGWAVEVVTGDGTFGWPAGAPYDRVLSTAAVQRVPVAWVEQTRPGGRILTPWGTTFHNGVLAELTVHGDGTAAGTFGGNTAFMWVRDQRRPYAVVEEHAFASSTTRLHPYEPIGDFDASFGIGLGLRTGVSSVLVFDDDQEGNPFYTVYLLAPESGSWASWRIEPGLREFPVRQHGPRRLFDEMEAAYSWWKRLGSPAYTRFGLTVTAQGQQVWLDAPDQLVASLVRL
ncbi:methyltransferase domain-containing protein [Nocardiopsis aegyptia]|uniref:methyltransferase domain-containing protein n=1 Tax=Nocardiopsis aegyptia TaxID=220378 RepID=UPI00366D2EA2